MKINESRFAKKKKRKVKPEKQKIVYLKNTRNKDSLDIFVEQDHSDEIFDGKFSKDDFFKLTKKWKEENLEK